MEKCAILDYIGPYRHPKYPNVTYFINCMDTLFDYVINNGSLLGYSKEQCERFYDLDRIDNREFKIRIQDQDTICKKQKRGYI